MVSCGRRIVLVLCLLAAARGAADAGQAAVKAEPGSELTVFLVTIGPGSATWELYGHNDFLIQDDRLGTDRLYSYGLFSWRQERFLWRFVKGRMLYRVGVFEAEPRMADYIAANRSVWIQELNLSPGQRAELQAFLEWNVRPENADYPYNYYYDNCSTRVRDALDRVLGGQLQQQTELRKGATYRFHTLRFAGNDVWLQTGLRLGLGQPVDRPISAWEEMFLPTRLRDHIRRVRVITDDGSVQLLVRSERTLYSSDRTPVPDNPPLWLLGYLAAGAALAGLILYLAVRSRSGPRGRRIFLIVASVFSAIIGVVGTLLAFLWGFTDHFTSFRNENLIAFNPLFLILAVLLFSLALGLKRAEGPAVKLAVVLAAASLLGFAAQLLPGWVQANGELYALALPPTLAVALGLVRGSR